MNTHSRRIRKLPKSWMPYVFALLMAGIMAFLMSMVIVAANTGIQTGYVGRVLHAYRLAMPIAFVCVLAVRPLVMALVVRLVEME